MKYGGPAGMQVFLDVLVFHVFVQFVGRLGEAEAGATTLTVRLNMVAFLPMLGLGQAVSILVGQRLGADRPDLAERSAYTGLQWVFGYMFGVAAVYLLIPGVLVSVFRGDRDRGEFRGGGRDRADAARLRGGLLAGRLGQRDVLIRPARGRRHSVCVAADLRAGLADHGRADLRRGPRRRQHLLGVGVRDSVHPGHGRLLLSSVSLRAMEEHAGDRGRTRWHPRLISLVQQQDPVIGGTVVHSAGVDPATGTIPPNENLSLVPTCRL